MTSAVLPERVVVAARGGLCGGLAVMLRFFMQVKNHFGYLVFLDGSGHAEVKKTEYLAEFDRERNFFIMDYANPRAAFAGRIEGRIMTKPELESALRAYKLFERTWAYPPHYREKLEKALSLLDNGQAGVSTMSIDVRLIPDSPP